MTSLLVPERSAAPERMDEGGHSRAALLGALSDIALVNRYLGGRETLLRALRPHLDSLRGRRVEILDLGTGGADLPLAIVREARRLGVEVRVVAIERDPVTASIAAEAVAGEPAIEIVRGDATRLPFAPRRFDLATASLFLHHFAHQDAVALVRALLGTVREAVIVNDLRRHRISWAFIALASRLTRRSAMFRHDAPLSVLRGFSDGELEAIAREAGASKVRVKREWPFRLLLEARP